MWTLINLTWKEDGWESVAPRAARLRELGAESKLRAMTDDTDLDVKDRARTALEQLRKAERMG